MHPITLASPGEIAFTLGPITVRWYGIMIAIGFFVATWAASFLCKRRNVNKDGLLDCAFASFIGGIIGARLYYAALNWQTFAHRPQEILATWLGGLSIHGGIVGGLLTGWVYCRVSKKLSFLNGADIVASVLPLAQAIGRWGNFFNSEAFGTPVGPDFPIQLYIPTANRPLAYATSQFFHPTFLYESIWDLVIFVFLYEFACERLQRFPGMTFLSYIFLYSIGRALIEPMRTDSIMVSGLAAPSVVSEMLIVTSIVGMILLRNYYTRHPVADATIQQDARDLNEPQHETTESSQASENAKVTENPNSEEEEGM